MLPKGGHIYGWPPLPRPRAILLAHESAHAAHEAQLDACVKVDAG